MKKFVIALSVQATTKFWDFCSLEAKDYTSTFEHEGLTIAATSDAKVTVQASSKSYIKTFPQNLSLNGTGKADRRNVSFNVSGRSLITIVFINATSNQERTLCLAKNEFDNVVKTTNVYDNKVTYLTYYHKGGDATYYAYSKNSGLRLYAIYVRDLGSDIVDTYDFEADANNNINPDNLNLSDGAYAWENSGKTNSLRNDYKGYVYTTGSGLPQYGFVFLRTVKINGNLKKADSTYPVGGLRLSQNQKNIIVAGVTAGMKVTVYYDATNANQKKLIWTSPTGDGSQYYSSTAKIGGSSFLAVSGETEIPSGVPIHIISTECGYISFMTYNNMVIQSIKVEMEEDVPTYLNTTDFNSMDDADISEIPAALQTAIEGLDIVDNTTGTALNISGSGSDETPNRYAVNGNKVALELNGGVLDFVAPEGYGIKKITFEYEEWNEANSADAGTEVEGTGIEVDDETKTAVWTGSSPEVKVNIAGKTVIKKIKIEIGERDGEPLVVDVADGANLNSIVDNAYAQNPYLGKVTLNLAKDGKYTVDGSLFVSRPLVINGAEDAEIDASANDAPFILMRPLPEIGLNEQGAYEISEISIKDVKITGLKNRLFYANRQNYLIGKLALLRW